MYTVDALIEIPEGSRNKYEYDRKTGRIYFNRMLFSSIRYPTNYGLIPNTLALDGDELDILVVTSEPVYPGCYVVARPIGGLDVGRKGERREDLGRAGRRAPLAIYYVTGSAASHMLLEIEHFFLRYKELEHKFRGSTAGTMRLGDKDHQGSPGALPPAAGEGARGHSRPLTAHRSKAETM